MTESAASQAHLAYLALEGLLVTLKLKPGSLVTERQLIALAGHGRTPVREAIQKLEWQGLIAVRPRAGLQITAIRPEDHAEVMATRRQLEPLAAELVARNADEAHRESLVACAQAMTACSIHSDIEGFLAADKAFDEIMEAACPNRFLTTALAPLQTHARRLWFARADSRQMDRSVDLHVKVIRAIRNADGPAAAAAMATLIDDLTG
ncbi:MULTISPECIES: GntR family transcriptional regulator [unclassified Shinella]|jgi:DNA-binding GntR family transcriptional regulator|uniref:GntR family transcriptional regulator n=1 Tax=unclassified Shinella TaxID=2643062 RepID=UPI00102D4913|nr:MULTISPECIES: GntR family transcriptional regulator [unclassified Shinella]MCO5149858.1 GntR family transcriptional regulator [Shinella sp.]MDC7262234.1 GntR family transcriptional regulator [Shinella sp. HY16]MDC7269129.1 GntR family transcriptional regulator [Shinella sp. YZ44]TAA61563.1 GntR family transcriptional regulator [Shinella sp. JR1-6]